MKDTLRQKLVTLRKRYHELSTLLSDPSVTKDQNRYREVTKEFSQLEPVVQAFEQYEKAEDDLVAAKEMLSDADESMKALAEEEIESLENQLDQIDSNLKILLLPQDPDDARNVYLEIRAGTGGDEAAIFAGDLFRMYSRFAEEMKWKVEVVSANHGEHGGYKELISRIIGTDVYAKLKFESGAHRVQRVPETETQGRIHTSACTVAVMPEPDEIQEVDIDPSQLRVDTYRSSGAGGQHVNTTDSAVRITHLPTGIVVECQEERSQHKNRAKAMSLLQAKILDVQRSEQEKTQAETRRTLVGSGDRSERIRTYNFPQGRVTDHRINLTLYKLPEIMEGHLLNVVEPLIQEHQADLLASVSE